MVVILFQAQVYLITQNPNQSLVSATEVNQEALGVYDFNSGLANAYNQDVVTAVGTSATATTTGLPTRNNRL